MPLFVAVVPPEWQMWGYNPKKFLLASLAVIFVPLTLKIVAPPLVSTPDEAHQRRVYNAISVDSVPSCSWAPRGRAHESATDATVLQATLRVLPVRPSVRLYRTGS